MRPVINRASTMVAFLGLVSTAAGCDEVGSFCNRQAELCKFDVIRPSTTTLGHEWDLRVTFPAELDGTRLSYVPLLLEQPGKKNPKLISLVKKAGSAEWGPEKPPIIGTADGFGAGTACLSLQVQLEEERPRFGKYEITITEPRSFSDGKTTTYTDMQSGGLDQYPWPVWVGVLPGSMAANAGRVILWSDGQESGLGNRARQIKTVSPDYQSAMSGVTVPTADSYTGMPQATPHPFAGIAHGMILLANSFGGPKLLVRQCDPTMSKLADCKSFMTADSDYLPPSISLYFGELGTKTLVAYATSSSPMLLKTNAFDSTATSFSDSTSKSINALAGAWDRVSFGRGAFTAKQNTELLVLYHGTASPASAVEIYSVSSDGTLQLLPDATMKLQNKLSSTSVQAMAVGDLDGDGLDDIAIAKKTGLVNKISLYLNQAEGTFVEDAVALTNFSSSTPISSLAIGNVGGSAAQDIVATVAVDKKAYVLINQSAIVPQTPCP